jgi:hypothetical protein
MSTDRALAQLRHAELLKESADLRADGAGPANSAWLALSVVVVLVLVAGAAWLMFVG